MTRTPQNVVLSSRRRRECGNGSRFVNDGPHTFLGPATRQDAPVGLTEVGVAQGVEHRVDCTVDIAEPVTCKERGRHL